MARMQDVWRADAHRAYVAAREMLLQLQGLADKARACEDDQSLSAADGAPEYAAGLFAWHQLRHWLNDHVKRKARAASTGQPLVKLTSDTGRPSLIEAIAGNLGLCHRNALYACRRQPLDPDYVGIVQRAASLEPPERNEWIERVVREEQAGINARTTLAELIDAVTTEWERLDLSSAKVLTDRLRLGTIDVEVLLVHLEREEAAVVGEPPGEPSDAWRRGEITSADVEFLDLDDRVALKTLSEEDVWAACELPATMQADVLWHLDSYGLVEARHLFKTRSPSRPTQWGSPSRQPLRFGRWEPILSHPGRDGWNYRVELRLTDYGRALAAQVAPILPEQNRDSGAVAAQRGRRMMPFAEARERAERIVKRNGGRWPGVNALKRQVVCGKSTIEKAINSSTYLSKLKAEAEAAGPRSTVRGASLVDEGNVPARREVDPAEEAAVRTDDPFARILDLASESEKERLLRLDAAGRQELVDLMLAEPDRDAAKAMRKLLTEASSTGRG